MLKEKESNIIFEMDFHARSSYSKIAKTLSLQKQTVTNTIKSLESRNIIKGYYADINPTNLGLTIYLVYLTFHKLTPKKEKEFIEHIAKESHIGVNASCAGQFDHCIGIWAKSIFEFNEILQRVLRPYETYIRTKTVMTEIAFSYFKPTFLGLTSDEFIEITPCENPVSIDKKDKKLLEMLAKNSRVKLTQISSNLDLTPAGIIRRIKNLENEKVILGYRLMINYELLGYDHYRIFLFLENSTSEKMKAITNYCKNASQIISLTKTIGYCDLEFRAVVKNINELYDLLDDLNNTFSGIIKNKQILLYRKIHQNLNYFPIN
ncbi:MAG: Lrp/AsnC family leucine-responsive transcriptional regulator [Candidatus Woesearchaeota archaeon]|jgi:Lrp/AsnC family leucine-responsive transcriptional regulator